MFVVIQTEPLAPGELTDAPTIIETWGPWEDGYEAEEWAGNLVVVMREHKQSTFLPHRFHVMEVREPVTPAELMGGSR